MTNLPTSAGDKKSEEVPIDYIYGAENIAAFLKINVRTVYYFLELKKAGRGDAPVHKKRGLGIYASKKALLEYMKTEH